MGNKPDHRPDQFFAFFVTTDLARKACTHAHFNSHIAGLFYSKACREKGSQTSGFFYCVPFYLWVPSMTTQKYASHRVTAFPFSFPHHKARNASWIGMFDLISFGFYTPS